MRPRRARVVDDQINKESCPEKQEKAVRKGKKDLADHIGQGSGRKNDNDDEEYARSPLVFSR